MDVKNGKVTTLEKIFERQKSFFDFYLKEENSDWKDTPHVIYEVRDQFYKGEFKMSVSICLPNTEYTPLYLNAENHTLNHAKISSAHVAQYDSEDKRRDVKFRNIRLSKDTGKIETMNLKLWVSTKDFRRYGFICRY